MYLELNQVAELVRESVVESNDKEDIVGLR